MQNKTIFELNSDDNKSKCTSNAKDVFKSAKKIMKNSTPNKVPQLLLLNFLTKFLIEKNEHINSCKAEIYLG